MTKSYDPARESASTENAKRAIDLLVQINDAIESDVLLSSYGIPLRTALPDIMPKLIEIVSAALQQKPTPPPFPRVEEWEGDFWTYDGTGRSMFFNATSAAYVTPAQSDGVFLCFWAADPKHASFAGYSMLTIGSIVPIPTESLTSREHAVAAWEQYDLESEAWEVSQPWI